MESDLCTTMDPGPPQSEDENFRINEGTGAGKTVTHICSELSRSRKVINNYLLSPKTYGTRKQTKISGTISAVVFQNINRSMSNNPKSVRAIAAEIPFKLLHKTIWRRLTIEGRITYRRLKKMIYHYLCHV